MKHRLPICAGALALACVLGCATNVVRSSDAPWLPPGTDAPPWSRDIGSDSTQQVNGLALDHGGNVFIAGEFGALMDFGGTVLKTPGGINGFQSAFLAKLDPYGG